MRRDQLHMLAVRRSSCGEQLYSAVEQRPVSEPARSDGTARSWICALLARYQREGEPAHRHRASVRRIPASVRRRGFDQRHRVGRFQAGISAWEVKDMQRYLLVLDMDLLALDEKFDLEPINYLVAQQEREPCEVVVLSLVDTAQTVINRGSSAQEINSSGDSVVQGCPQFAAAKPGFGGQNPAGLILRRNMS